MTELSEKRGQYGFIVERSANKVEIRKAVEDQYKVTVTSVNTMVYAGKTKKRFTKGAILFGRGIAPKKQSYRLQTGILLIFTVIFN